MCMKDIKRLYKLWKHVSGAMRMSFALSIVELPLALSCPADEGMKLPGSLHRILKGCHDVPCLDDP